MANNNLTYCKTYREEARTKRATLDDRIFKLDELKEKMNEVENKLKPLEERYNAILFIEENLSSLRDKLLTSEGNLKSIRLAQKELKSVIKLEFIGNDSELEEALKNFNNNLLQKEQEKNRLSQEKSIEVSKEMEIQENISKEQVNLGRYQNEEKQNQNNIQKQNSRITELSRLMDINLPDLFEHNRREVITDLSNEINSKNNKLESTKKEHKQIEDQMQIHIDTTRVEKAKLDQDIKIKEKQIVDNTFEIKKLKEVVEQIKQSAQRLEILKKLKDDNNTKSKTLNESINFDEIKTEINKKKQEKIDINLKLEVVEKEVQKLQLLSVEQAELDTIKTNKSGVENKLKILKNKVNNVLNDLLGFIPQEKLKYEFTTFLDKLSNEIRTNRNSIEDKQKQYTILEANFNHTKEKLRVKQKDLSDDENALSDMCQGQEYETLLKEVNEKVEELQDQKGSVSTSGHLFKRYIKNLEAQDPSCPLCHRGFTSIDEVTELINDLNIRVQKIPIELDTTITQLEIYLEKQSKLHQLKHTYTRISILNNSEIPKLKAELETIGNNLKKCRDELTKLLDSNGKLETNETNAKNIQSDVIMIDSYYNDISRYTKDEQRLIKTIVESGSTRNLQEAINEQNSLRSILNDICNVLEKKQHEITEYNETSFKLQVKRNKIINEELTIKCKIQDEKSALDKLNELNIIETVLRVELDEAKNTVEPIQKKLEEHIKKLEETKKFQNEKITNNLKEIMLLEKKFLEINNLQTSIDDYKKKGWSLRINEINNSLEDLKKQKIKIAETQINIQREIDSINEYNANQEIQKIDLENNKKLRQKSTAEIECLSEIHELKDKVGNLDVNSLIREKKDNREKSEHLVQEKNKALGRKLELENVIEITKKELAVSHYRNAEKNYLDQKVQLEVLHCVDNDLNKYIKALEWALNRFHSDHMQSINTIIKNLWRDIYTGNDIDYIQIKTSDDNKPISTDSSKRRVFNYRIVQIKNDVELDMRGRCSAGQKVLACLIVRMALAETFSKNCGILALDEPTTNLDEANIQSLAESLSEIITRRSSQKSFQLIIITHDPSFLSKLSARDMVDTYYEVQRNNNGVSVVYEKDMKLLH
ncbi:Hypothetical protein CINCED_3A008104 [Cinara cedri]|nr:Hypothetical protein CINCED_3A008104 [Cinara cedri]